MRDLDSFVTWFREQAVSLPDADRAAVMAVLLNRDARAIFMGLDSLERKRRLPHTWHEMLSDLYWTLC